MNRQEALWRIELQSFLEIFSGFIEAAQVTVRESQKCVGARRRVELHQFLKFVDRLFSFARHEVAFPECSAQVGPLRSGLDAGFEQGNRILKIVLRHADARQQKNDVHVLRRQLVGAGEQVEGIRRAALFGSSLSQLIKSFGGLGFKLQRAIQRYFGFFVFATAYVSLAQVVEDFESFRLQRVGFFQFTLSRFVLFR